MDELKKIIGINEIGEEYSLNRIVANEQFEPRVVYCGASDSYFEDM